MELATIFPSKYIKAADLQGREPTVVMARAEIEKIGDDSKLVLYFQGKEKGLVCNRTNADRIAYLYGSNTDGWLGKEIILYTEMVNFQGKVTEAIRVKPPKQQPKQQSREEQSGFVKADHGKYDVMERRKTHPMTENDPMDDGEIPF